MTGPTSGFADWQQYASWRGQMFVNESVTLSNGGLQSLGQFAVGNYASVRVRIFSIANGAEVFLYGQDDEFGSQRHLIKRWVNRPNTSIHCLVPIPTTYISAEVQGEAAAAWDGYVAIQPVNVAVDKVHYYGFNSSVNVFNANLNPGAVAQFYPPVLLPGPAHIWALSAGGLVNVQYEAWTYTSAGVDDILLCQYQNIPAIGLNDQFEIPERPWRLQVRNATAANQVYFFTVTSRGNLT